MEVNGDFKNHFFLTEDDLWSNHKNKREMFRRGEGFGRNTNGSTKCFGLGTNAKGIFNSKLAIESDKSAIVTYAVMRSRPWQTPHLSLPFATPLLLSHQRSSLAKCDARCSVLTCWDISAAVITMDHSLLGTLSVLPPWHFLLAAFLTVILPIILLA